MEESLGRRLLAQMELGTDISIGSSEKNPCQMAVVELGKAPSKHEVDLIT